MKQDVPTDMLMPDASPQRPGASVAADERTGAGKPDQAMQAVLDMVLRVSAGGASADDLAWLGDAIGAALGVAPGVYVLRSWPSTPVKCADLRRNVCIVRAFRAHGGTPQEFKRRWDTFATTTFRLWRDDGDDPPPNAQPLETHLYHATKLCRGQTLEMTRLNEILSGNVAGKRGELDPP